MTKASNLDVTALATLVHSIRPGWDTRGIAWAAHRLGERVALPELVIAFVKGALDEANETPAAMVHLDNRAWEDVHYPPCKTHPLVRARRTNGECAGCYADRVASETPGVISDRGGSPIPAGLRAQVLDAARARSARANADEEREGQYARHHLDRANEQARAEVDRLRSEGQTDA